MHAPITDLLLNYLPDEDQYLSRIPVLSTVLVIIPTVHTHVSHHSHTKFTHDLYLQPLHTTNTVIILNVCTVKH